MRYALDREEVIRLKNGIPISYRYFVSLRGCIDGAEIKEKNGMEIVVLVFQLEGPHGNNAEGIYSAVCKQAAVFHRRRKLLRASAAASKAASFLCVTLSLVSLATSDYICLH